MSAMTKYHIFLNLREKTMVFWTLAFPVLLGLFFYFGLGGIDDSAKFSPIPVAVLGEQSQTDRSDGQMDEQTLFAQFLGGISGELIAPAYGMSEAEAMQALESGEVLGVFDNTGESPKLTLGADGTSESILKALLDGFEQQTGIIKDIQADLEAESRDAASVVQTAETPQEAAVAAERLQQINEDATARIQQMTEDLKENQADYIREVSLGGREVSSVTPYYFALVAMACLYMCFLGETAAKRTQANISEIGKRLSVSPAPRLRVVISNGISAYVIALINMTLVMLFMICVLHGLDISAHPGYAILTCMMGCLIGVTFGILIESIGKWGQKMKTAILIGSSIFCAFLAGLMISSIKDLIEKNIPIVNRINPAALIADSFYCICVYDDMGRLAMNLGIMGGMSALFLLGSWILTRRVRYDSL